MKYLNPATLAVFLAVFLFGCKTKESTLRTDIVRDTVYVSTNTVKQPQILEKVYVPNICDTLTNTVTEFERVVVIGQDTARLSLVENTLMFEIKKLEQIIKQKDSINQNRTKDTVIEKEVIKYKTPTWIWLILAGAILTFLVSIKIWRFF